MPVQAGLDAELERKKQALMALQGGSMNVIPPVENSGPAIVPESSSAVPSEGPSTAAKLAAVKTMADAIGPQSGVGNTDTASSVGKEVLTGTTSGFILAGGPGAAVGAVAGGVVGALQASAARKEKERQAAAAHYNRLANIEVNKSQMINSALANMGQAMGASLSQNRKVKL